MPANAGKSATCVMSAPTIQYIHPSPALLKNHRQNTDVQVEIVTLRRGKGADFTFATITTLSKTQGARMPRILVIDDMAIFRDVVSAGLGHAGYETDTATNGREALTKCKATRPDLVMLDIAMPVMDGLK